MEIFLKAVAGVLVCTAICLALSKQGNDFSHMLSIAICVMVVIGATYYIDPVVTFISKLQSLAGWQDDMLRILLKAVGIGILSEITTLICSDAGYAAMGKTLQILSTCAVLWISLPLITELVELLENILGAL